MSSIKSKPRQLLRTIPVNLCCSCRRPKLSSIFSPKPKSKSPPPYQAHHHHRYMINPLSYCHSSSSSSTTTTTTSSSSNITRTTSSFMEHYPSSSNCHPADGQYYLSNVDGLGRRIGPKTVAVEKESSDPYFDFRQSMLQMIVENEIYAKEELKGLLNCFLQLNSPYLHGVIIRVFTEIWNSFFFNINNGDGDAAAAANGVSRRNANYYN